MSSGESAVAEGHARYLALRHFGSLDGLRALSIIAVVWHHTAASAMGKSPLSYLGSEGVILFFAISGFLITTLLLRERDRHGHIDLKAFYVRRSLRIFPLYYAVLLIYVLLVWLLERDSLAGQQFFANLPAFATYTSNFFVALDGRVIFYFAWSLATEEQFYLIWPPLLMLLRSTGRALWLLGLLALAVLGWDIAAQLGVAGPADMAATRGKLPLSIVLGTMAALALHSSRGYARLAPWVSGRSASLLWLLAMLAALAWPYTPRALQELSMAGLVVACVVTPGHVLARPLSWAPLGYIGMVSYGLYLIHTLVKNVIDRCMAVVWPQADWTLTFPLTVLIGTAVAGLSFRYFESIFLRRKLRFER